MWVPLSVMQYHHSALVLRQGDVAISMTVSHEHTSTITSALGRVMGDVCMTVSHEHILPITSALGRVMGDVCLTVSHEHISCHHSALVRGVGMCA